MGCSKRLKFFKENMQFPWKLCFQAHCAHVQDANVGTSHLNDCTGRTGRHPTLLFTWGGERAEANCYKSQRVQSIISTLVAFGKLKKSSWTATTELTLVRKEVGLSGAL